jgi:phenylalanyl-tRNA synthetase alpha chain
MNKLIHILESTLQECLAAIAAAKTFPELESIKVHYLGRQGAVSQMMKNLGTLSLEERPEAGKKANHVKIQLQEAMDQRLAVITRANDSARTIDVTLPGRRRKIGYKHPINQVIDDAIDIFRRMGFIVADGPDIEDDYHNFDALNTPLDHPARDLQDTFYFADGRLLRTHTSPVQIRVMEGQQPPVRIIAAGRCYRRDTPDATHSMNFHQIEGLYVNRQVSMAELKGTLLRFAHEMFGTEVQVRFRPHFFPFTEPSLEYDFSCINCRGTGCSICKQSGWLEISGAGMVDPAVFTSVGYDPESYTGFAFGMGVERLAMIRYNIPDIRLLYENDVRFLQQF